MSTTNKHELLSTSTIGMKDNFNWKFLINLVRRCDSLIQFTAFSEIFSVKKLTHDFCCILALKFLSNQDTLCMIFGWIIFYFILECSLLGTPAVGH